jgi:ribosomal-protein-serine acetyltransferase|tara:strand:- start:29 stop:673 length:645 start_codon:yes stop_codon:yes gene_type:complete
MQIHIRPFKTSDAAELQSAVLESIGHLGPWLDWATPRYLLGDARTWVDESRVLWANQTAYRWIITNEESRRILGSVEISQSSAGAGLMGYWLRRQVLGKGICTQAARAALDYVFQRGLFEQVDLYIDPLNAASLAVAQKLGAELQGERADGIIYRGAAKPALHWRVSAKSLSAQEGPTHNSRLSSPESVERLASECERADGVYEFKRSLKNARL